MRGDGGGEGGEEELTFLFSKCVFAYLKNLPFTQQDFVGLQQSPFIFCESLNRFVTPRDVFISNASTQQQFGDILNYVDFGPDANPFLKQYVFTTSLYIFTLSIVSPPICV
jgi:Protein of unknown function (DUF3684)